MYTREEASGTRQAFWTAFGQYMMPVLSADGAKINWINYKTGEKHLYFKMRADKTEAFVAIELSHPDTDIQQLYFEQFLELKKTFHSIVNEEWIWRLHTEGENGKIISKIYTVLSSASIYKREDWPALILFFKPRLIALDDFWSVARYSFEALRS